MNICCVFVAGVSFEIKTEAEYPHADMPSTGMIVLHYDIKKGSGYRELQVTCPKGHLSEVELPRFRDLTLTDRNPNTMLMFRTSEPSDK